jgi:hypothetical protein
MQDDSSPARGLRSRRLVPLAGCGTAFPIGALFSVQLKSTEQPAYSANGDLMSVELDIPNARYLARELETPKYSELRHLVHSTNFYEHCCNLVNS